MNESIEPKGVEVAKQIERMVNCFGTNDEVTTLVDELVLLHRTLNQSFVSQFILPFVRTMAGNYNEKYFDDRNKMACRICNVMWEAVKNELGLKDGESASLPLI